MDLEGTMRFIVETLAQLTASAQKHEEQIAKNDAQIARNDAQIAAVTDLVGRLAQAEIHLAEKMQGHEARLSSLETKSAQLFERMDRFIQGLEGDGHKLR